MTLKKKYVGNVRELKVYKKALLWRKELYEIAKAFPQYEMHNLGQILRNSSCSVASNLAEGNTNYYYKKEYNHLNMSLSKIANCRSLLDIAQMEGYISEEIYIKADMNGEEILKMIIGMMNRIESHLNKNQNDIESKEGVNDLEIDPTIIEDVYEIATFFYDCISDIVKRFPLSEEKNMKDQIIRASKSILENLEFSKTSSYPQSFLELNTAIGSISECSSFLDMSFMEGFITVNQYNKLNDVCYEIFHSINLLMNQMKQIIEEKYQEVF